MYHCGGDEGWSDVFVFTALNDSLSFSPRFAFYGDLGNENPQSLARLQEETQLGMYDVILHIGNLCIDVIVIIVLLKGCLQQLKTLVLHRLRTSNSVSM